jgi:hypothetical protein
MPADTTKPEANATGKGLYASQGGPIRSAQKASGPSAAGLPPKTRAAIDKALRELDIANILLRVAEDRLSKKPDDGDLRKQYDTAKTKFNGARANLGQVIASEADRLSPRSSLVPKEQRHTAASKNPPPSVTKVRDVEAKVVNGTPSADRDEVAAAILKSKELRVADELARASAAMLAVAQTNDPHLNHSQAEERKSIVADVRDCVTQARPQEEKLAPEELAKAQLARFKSIADRVAATEGKFDPFLFAMMKDGVRANIPEAYRDKFDALAGSYSGKLAPRY